MDILILCKDCGEQFKSGQLNKTMQRIEELSTVSSFYSIKFSECMGICPTGKICTIRSVDNQINLKEKIPLFPDEICKLLSE